MFRRHENQLRCSVENGVLGMNDIVIAGRKIGGNHAPFIVAEMSGNHNQSLDRALKIVEAAAAAGAHAVKIQTYTADTMTLDIDKNEFHIETLNLWKGKSLYQLYQQAYTPWEWHKAIFDRCEKLGLIYFSTPFDESSVDFLESLKVPCYKIASFENGDLPLIRRVANTGKPLIISTGMASLAELDETIQCAKNYGCHDIILLKCTSSYPSTPENSNLLSIPHMRSLFDVPIGLSDHTLGIGAALAGVALGSVMIEKHFTLARSDGGIDSAFSIEPDEMRSLVVESINAQRSLGKVHYGATEQERPSIKYRRSLYIVENMRAGEVINKKNMRCIRPGLGLSPRYYEIILGRRIARDVEKGTALTWDLVR